MACTLLLEELIKYQPMIFASPMRYLGGLWVIMGEFFIPRLGGGHGAFPMTLKKEEA